VEEFWGLIEIICLLVSYKRVAKSLERHRREDEEEEEEEEEEEDIPKPPRPLPIPCQPNLVLKELENITELVKSKLCYGNGDILDQLNGNYHSSSKKEGEARGMDLSPVRAPQPSNLAHHCPLPFPLIFVKIPRS
jgi:hypothetical protein